MNTAFMILKRESLGYKRTTPQLHEREYNATRRVLGLIPVAHSKQFNDPSTPILFL